MGYQSAAQKRFSFGSENHWISSLRNEVDCLDISGEKQITHFGATR